MSLSAQLSQIATANATLVLDRKKRQKLHQVSLIYNAKTAATQDYEFIFSQAVSALDELITLDSRFAIFKRSLFSETSVSLDRNQQTKEQLKDLDNAINAYLLLCSQYWNLNPTLHATEWLVRRFQIHIHNNEMLMLTTFNYFNQVVFKRILNIVKLPALFQPLSMFIRTDKLPSSLTVIKIFSDFDFVKLYAGFMMKSISKKCAYQNQLLFTTCSLINVIAASNDDKLIPVCLELCAKMLASSSPDCQIAAHTVLVVLATAKSLTKNIICAATETILTNVCDSAKRSAWQTITKMFQTLKETGNVDQLPIGLYKLFISKMGQIDPADTTAFPRNIHVDKFVTCYVRSVIRYDHENLSSIVEILKAMPLEKFELRYIVIDLIHLSEVIVDKQQLITVFEYLISKDEALVIKCLKNLQISTDEFEIRLTTSLFSVTSEGSVIVPASTGPASAATFKEFLTKNSEHIVTKKTSMLLPTDISKLLSLFVESVSLGFSVPEFLASFFSTVEARTTFALRVAVSPQAPISIRILAVQQLQRLSHSIDSNLFTLIPVLLYCLTDVSKPLRVAVIKALQNLNKGTTYFMQNELYGGEMTMISPKAATAWLSSFLDNHVIDSCNVRLWQGKDNVMMLFWSQQAISMPLANVKTFLLDYITSQPSYSSGVFEDMLNNYNSQEWEEKCKANKTDFVKFESILCQCVSVKDKNVDFLLKSLNGGSIATLAAQRLVVIYPSLKFQQQSQIVETIVDASDDVNYDSIDTLQSLPISAKILTKILSKQVINQQPAEIGAPKRRRRSSSSIKMLQQDNIAVIAEQHLKKLTIVLEVLDKLKVEGTEELLHTLFNLLSDLDTLDQDGGLPVLYAQETLASCMLHCVKTLETITSVRADIIVSTIRTSQSPILQNKLLLVVASLAEKSPEVILHSVMPIFTFMGAHTIRQDDEFSRAVVEQTIKFVVPALLTSEDSEFLLLSFVTAFSHVPRHRRVSLYTTLLKTLGNSLDVFIDLIGGQYNEMMEKFKISEANNMVTVVDDVLKSFSLVDQINALCGALNKEESKLDFIDSLVVSMKVRSLSYMLENGDDELPFGHLISQVLEKEKLLTHVLDLLPIKPFVGHIMPLLDDDKVRDQVTALIPVKFEVSDDVEEANLLMEKLLSINLSSVAFLINKFGERLDTALLTQALQVATTNLANKEDLVDSMSVISFVITTLGVKTIAFYSKIVPQTLALYSKDEPELHLSIVLLFASLVQKLPSFVSSNLQDVVQILLSSTVAESVKLSLVNLIVEQIDAPVILKTLLKVWSADLSALEISLYLSLMEATIEKIDKKQAAQQCSVFFKIMTTLFDYRSVTDLDNNTVSRIESSMHQVAISYVLKLNDKVFRPLFANLVTWAFDNSKQLAFFKFFNKLQDNLKGIITSYFTYLIEPVTKLLGTTGDVNLRRLIYISLTSSFKYDQDEYWKSSSRFELLAQTLADQLATVDDVIGKYLVKAIGALAQNNSGSEDHNKQLNQLLISHMKADAKNREKYWAVKCMKLVYSKVGEQWLVLLPQLVPIIAELLEDDDEEVESEVRTGLVKVVENVLGEPFDRYLD